jgi:Notch-like protein
VYSCHLLGAFRRLCIVFERERATGWAGDNCVLDVDECVSSPCWNLASCVESSVDATIAADAWGCLCVAGWANGLCIQGTISQYKDQCATDNAIIDPRGRPVRDNGVCNIDINECISSPCQNAGACSDSTVHGGVAIDKYTCVCRPGYSGDNCVDDLDECASTPCTHDAREHSCTGSDDGTGALCALCTTTDCTSCKVPTAPAGCVATESAVDAGSTCALSANADECVSTNLVGRCAAVVAGADDGAGAACALNADSSACKVTNGDSDSTDNCVYELVNRGISLDCNYTAGLGGNCLYVPAVTAVSTATCNDGADAYTCSCPAGHTGDNCATEVCRGHALLPDRPHCTVSHSQEMAPVMIFVPPATAAGPELRRRRRQRLRAGVRLHGYRPGHPRLPVPRRLVRRGCASLPSLPSL